MKFSMWVNGRFQLIEAKTEAKALAMAKKLYGDGNFTEFKRYYEGKNSRDHKLHFLRRAISNIPKHLHKEQRKGL